MSYTDFSKKTASRKYILATLEAKRGYKVFESMGGGIYRKAVTLFTSSVKVNGVNLTLAGSESLSAGQWFYNSQTGYVSIRLSDSSDPKLSRVYFTHRLFYSNIPINAPSDVTSGVTVNYEGRIASIGEFKLELDYEQTGIALTSDSSISLISSDGHFKSIFDTLIFENGRCRIFSYGDELLFSQAKLIYSGLISSKSFTANNISFSIKDETDRLDSTISVGKYSTENGDIVDEKLLGTNKNILIGKFNSFKTSGIDNVLSGYPTSGVIDGNANRNLLSGTASGAAGQKVITGVGTLFTTQLTAGSVVKFTQGFTSYQYTVDFITNNTQLNVTVNLSAILTGAQMRDQGIKNNRITGVATNFLKEVVQNDKIRITSNAVDYDFTVESISANDELFIAEEIVESFTGRQYKVLPAIPYRFKNRRWSMAGHKLVEFSVTITQVVSTSIFKVSSITDFEVGDYVKILNFYYIIGSVYGDTLTITQAVRESVSVSNTITKFPVSAVYNGRTRLVIDRDFQIENTLYWSNITLNEFAEFNTAPDKATTVQLNMTSGSRVVTTPSTTADLTLIFKPRDFIKGNSINITQWFEVSEVYQSSLKLTAVSTYTYSGSVNYRSPDYVSDSSIVTTDCLGLYTNKWIRYPSDAVKYILETIGVTNINAQSFIDARNDCEMTLCLPIVGASRKAKDIISDINKSVFASLFIDDNFNFKYKILNSDVSGGIESIDDSDIFSYSINTKSNIVNSVIVSYSPINSKVDGSQLFNKTSRASEFVNEAIEKSKELETVSYVFSESDAAILSGRWLLFRSLTQSVISLKAPISLIGKTLNDVIAVNFDKMYQRFGNSTKKKLGLINSISKGFDSVSIQVNDISNIFARIGKISPNSVIDYSSAGSELDVSSFIVDNNTETPNPASEDDLGCNIIG